MEKIGVAIITYKRFWSFKKVFDSIPFDKIDELIIVNATPEAENHEYIEFKNTLDSYSEKIKWFYKPKAVVGINKNIAFKYFLEKTDCKHIFLIENDIEIIDKNVFEKYISAAKESGIPHLMFGYHGKNNLDKDGNPKPILKIKYDTTMIWFNGGCVGAFNYYERECLLRVGLMDERYTNANEHISHTFRYSQFGFLPGYMWYPDIENSHLYLRETVSPDVSTTIPIENENIRRNCEIFKMAHTPPNEPRVGFPDYKITPQHVLDVCRVIKSRNLV